MTKVRSSNGSPIIRSASAAIAYAILVGIMHVPCLLAAEETTVKMLVEQMLAAGEKYDPQPLLKHGVAGLRGVMDQIFPETIDIKDLNAEKIAALVEQLGDESFQRREAATVALRRLGAKSVNYLRPYLEHKDAEVRSRVRKLLADAEKPPVPKSYPALEKYLDKLKDVKCQQELARRVNQALEARYDLTPEQGALKVCLLAMTRWPTDRIHGELLPLLKLEDPAPAIFAMHQISGRTGNSYVSAIHLGAIASGRPELVKCGFRSMPGPVWDEKAQPRIKTMLEHVFDDSLEFAELRSDGDFMFLCAFVAARDYRMPVARRWLIAKISKGDQKESLRAVQSLGDTYYMRNPLDLELLAALEPHLKSKDPKLRAAAVRTLGVYRGDAVQPELLRAFADPVKEVWRQAGERLKDQHSYSQPESSPIPKLLESALQTTADAEHKARLEFLLKHLQQENPGFLKWPD